jgi:hypothetical protein
MGVLRIEDKDEEKEKDKDKRMRNLFCCDSAKDTEVKEK